MYDKKIKIHTKNKSKIIHFDYNYISNIIYIYKILENISLLTILLRIL